ncbi:MAG: LysM peptidoglycan-binding domain-containing protein [Chloroflexi bacterium]|nr:LysM peptidoglycan-binding domain-containing protein [Chloroflexota bacterium]
MSLRRILPFILLNIVVSAAVMLSILYWWEGRQVEQVAETEANFAPVVALPTGTPTAVAQFLENTPIPSPESNGSTDIYIVKAGDTLGSISTTFDVPMEDIMEANGLTDPNLLSVGQQLTIPPVGGLPTATPTATPSPTPPIAPSPIPTEPLTQGEVVIEINEVVGVGNLTEEAVSIINTGSRPVALQDWKLRDGLGIEYTFGQITLFGDGAGILVHSEAGISTSLELYWGLQTAVWEPGETVTLLNRDGVVQATYTIPTE